MQNFRLRVGPKKEDVEDEDSNQQTMPDIEKDPQVSTHWPL